MAELERLIDVGGDLSKFQRASDDDVPRSAQPLRQCHRGPSGTHYMQVHEYHQAKLTFRRYSTTAAPWSTSVGCPMPKKSRASPTSPAAAPRRIDRIEDLLRYLSNAHIRLGSAQVRAETTCRNAALVALLRRSGLLTIGMGRF